MTKEAGPCSNRSTGSAKEIQNQGLLTVGPTPRHLVELLPGEGPLHVLDVLPGPACALLLDSILQEGLQGQQHAHHVLR